MDRPPFDTDRTTLLRAIRAFAELLFDRVIGTDGEPCLPVDLPGGFCFDNVVTALVQWDLSTWPADEALGIEDQDRLAGIVATLRQLLESR